MELKKLPNATVSLVLGILSLITCICYGVFSLPLGIIAIVLGQKAINLHNEQPTEYTGIGNATAGKVIGIIGVILSVLWIVTIIYLFYLIGFENFGDKETMEQRMLELFGQQ